MTPIQQYKHVENRGRIAWQFYARQRHDSLSQAKASHDLHHPRRLSMVPNVLTVTIKLNPLLVLIV